MLCTRNDEDKKNTQSQQIYSLNYELRKIFGDSLFDYAPPFPSSHLKSLSLLQSDFVDLLSDVDRDVGWLCELLLSDNMEDAIMSDAINPRLLFLNQHVFTVACAVVQKVCARNYHTCALIKKGVKAFYSYIVKNVLENKEAYVVEYLVKHNKLIKKHDIDVCFSSQEDKECFIVLFEQNHPHSARPRFLLSLPWINALSLVSIRRAFLYNGLAYFSYADAPEIAFDAWSLVVQNWKKWDLENIFVRLATDRQRQAITSDTLPKAKNSIMYEIATDVSRAMTKSNYTERTDSVLEQMCVTTAIKYVQVPKSTTEVVIPHGNTGDFIVDFSHCMPPCIMGIVMKHIVNNTHMVYAERYIVFSWTYQVKAPFTVVESFWLEMVSKDRHVDSVKKASLLKELSTIYQSLDKRVSSGTHLFLKSCESMQQYCPYSSDAISDIEDVVSSSISKCKSTCGGTYSKYWSLMAATIARSKKK